MSDAPLYLVTKQRVVDYMGGLSEEQLGSRCIACPDWTVLETLAHHVHAQRCLTEGTSPDETLTSLVASDAVARRAAERLRDEWTRGGVEARRGWALDEVLAEGALVAAAMGTGRTALADLTAHFDDIRETLEGRVPRVGPDIEFSLTRLHHLLGLRLAAAGQQQVGFACPDIGLVLHGRPEAGVVTGPSYELLRSVFSRRRRGDADQVLHWGTTTPGTQSLFAVYGWPANA